MQSSAHAATGTWTGGAGATWDTTTANWSNLTGTPWDLTNGGTNAAVFNTAGATSTVSGTVYANAITFANTATISGGSISLAGTTPTITSSSNGIISSILTGASGLTKAGAATLTLTGSNSYSGTTNITAGVVNIQNASALGGTAQGTTVAAGAQLQLQGGITVTGESLSINASGVNALLSFSGNNTWAGAITADGVASFNSNGDLTAYNRIESGNGSLLTLSGPITIAAPAASGTASGLLVLGAGNMVISGAISGGKAGNISFVSSSNGAGTRTLSGSNSYLGWTSFNGNLTLEGGNAIPDTSRVVSNAAGGRLVLNASETIGGLAASNAGAQINLNANTLTIGADNTTPGGGDFGGASYQGTIIGTGGITKIGSGTLRLSGSNTYTGATKISGGNLALDSAGSFADSGTVTVGDAGSSGAVLDLTNKTGTFAFTSGQTVRGIGTINIGAGKTVSSAGIWAPGNSIGSNTVTGNLTLTGTSQYELGTPGTSLTSPGTSDFTAVSGTLTLGGNLQLIDNANAGGLGSAAGGVYRLFTYGNAVSGSFASVTNPSATTRTSLDNISYGGSGTAAGNGVFVSLYNLASATSAQTVNVGNTYAGTAKTAVVSLANTAPTNATYTETLSTGGFTSTSANFTATGSASGITGGSSGTGTLLVGLGSGLSAGTVSGTTTLALFSNAVNSSGLAQQSAGSQTLTITGTVWNPAAVNSITTPVSLGNVRVGGTFGSSGLTITNTAASGQFTEVLGATASTSGLASSTGSVSALASGSTSTAIQVGLGGSDNTGSAGIKTGTATLTFTSSGPIGTATIAPQTLVVSSTVFNPASANTLPATISLGNVYAGSSFTGQTLSIWNTVSAATAFQEGLNATITGTSGGASASGSITNLYVAGGTSSAISVGLTNAGSAGVQSGTVSLGFASNGTLSGLSNLALGSQSVALTGTVWNAAGVNSITTPITLGNVRVGGTFASSSLTITNTAAAGSYTEVLGATATTSGLASRTGSVSALAGGGTSSAIQVGLGGSNNTGSAGIVSGTATLAFTSTGGPSTASIQSQNVAISGTVWNAAQATTSGSVNLGAVIVGASSLSQALSITNSAPGSFSESLNASFGTLSGVTTNSGSIALLAAGSTDSAAMTVSLAANTVGNLSGSAQVNFATDGQGTSGLAAAALSPQTVNVYGTVLDHATPGFLGVLDPLATGTLALNFGSVDETAGLKSLTFSLTNLAASAGADLTAGLALTGTGTELGSGFSLSGAAFSNLLAGGTSGLFTVGFTPSGQGSFSQTFRLSFSDNTNLAGAVARRDLFVAANVIVVPEPGALALAGIGMAAAAWALRRRM